MIEFSGVNFQTQLLRHELEATLKRVMQHGLFIMGPEVLRLEGELSKYIGAYAVTCASGTDALLLAIKALGIKSGSCIVVPSFTFCATAEAVCNAHCIPMFADVEKLTGTVSVATVDAAIRKARRLGLEVSAIIGVDLFGLPAPVADLRVLADSIDADLIVDGAQSFGASIEGKRSSDFADVWTTSFFPAKPLGCLGDGGAVFTRRSDLADRVRSLRSHGAGADKYDNIRVGMNSRLDTLQAAFLLEKLRIYDDELAARRRVVSAYLAALPHSMSVLRSQSDLFASAWSNFTVVTRGRDDLRSLMVDSAVPSATYYRVPIHRQHAYSHFPKSSMVNTDWLAEHVLSVPLHPYLVDDEIDLVLRVLMNHAERRTPSGSELPKTQTRS